MTRTTNVVLALTGMLVLGCARASTGAVAVSQPLGTDLLREIDQPCNAANVTITGAARNIPFDNTEFSVPQRWIPLFKSVNDIDFDLRRTGEEVHVWKGGSWTFPTVLPMNTTSCELQVANMGVKVQTTMLVQSPRLYRVDVTWAPLFDGQHLYMQMTTRFPENLKQMRGVIESVRPMERAAMRP
jgi:hypothetical protein